MRILTRYLIRSHIGPFLFSFVLLTGLLFVNTLAKRLEDLVGRGLPSEVITEAVLLTLPHTIALTLPIAVLVAVLYAFSELASASEIVAMSASGVRPRSLLVPVLVAGTIIGGVTYTFNDRILPEANHRLKNLRNSILQKSPTFQLRERVVNEIQTENSGGPYFIRAAAIDPVSSELTDVVIHDLSHPGVRRTTYADRGEMALNASITDLHLRLREGYTYEVGNGKAGTFQQTRFEEQLYVLRGVGDVFEDQSGDYRSDREMSVAMLREAVAGTLEEADTVRAESQDQAVRAVEHALGSHPDSGSVTNRGFMSSGRDIPPDDLTRTTAVTARTNAGRISALRKRINEYRVEIHKKFVIASACIVFVLIGAPLGVRFPRGRMGMVILVSGLVVGVYQIGLTNGEARADRNLANPFWAMWLPSLLFFMLGVFMATRMGRWIASVRGNSWREMWTALLHLPRLAFERLPFGLRRTPR